MIENIIIRNERKEDYRKVENLTREAFWNVYRPGCTEHYVLHCYRDDPAFVPELDFVMELNGELIGQIIYVRSEIDCDDGRKLPIMTFGPIGIAPEYKGRVTGNVCSIIPWKKPREWASARWRLRAIFCFTVSRDSFPLKRKACAMPTTPMRIIFSLKN